MLPWGKYLKICAQAALIAALKWETYAYLHVEIRNVLGQCVWFGAANSNECLRTATAEKHAFDKTRNEMRHKKKQLAEKTSQVIAMYRRFHFLCGQGVTKNLDRCQIVAANLRRERSVFCCSPKLLWSHPEKLEPHRGLAGQPDSLLSQVLCITPVLGSKRWVLGHGIHNGVFLFFAGDESLCGSHLISPRWIVPDRFR